MLEYRCRQLVELVFNMSTILLYNYDTLQATPHWLILPSMNLCDSARHSSKIAFFNCTTFWNFLPWYTRSCRTPKWHNPPGLSLGCSVATRNALITILSSRVILPIKMHKRGYYSTVLFFMKTGSYSQNITINANTNKY